MSTAEGGISMRVFLSYVYEDVAYVKQIQDWATSGQLGGVQIVTESEDVRQYGSEAVYAYLRQKMRQSDLILVLVGQDTHNRKWVDSEIHYFVSAGRPILATRVPNTTGGVPPSLAGHGLLSFRPETLKAAIHKA